MTSSLNQEANGRNLDLNPARELRSSPLRNEVISIDPERLSGAPCFAGTRVPIQTLWDYLEGGDSLDEFLDGFPGVTREQAVAVLEFARERLLTDL